MSVIPNGFAEIALEFTIPGDAGPAMVVFGVEDTGIFGTADGVADNVEDTLNNVPGVTSWTNTLITITKMVTRLRVSASSVLIDERAPGLTGLDSGSLTPPQTSLLFTKNTGFAGRQNRGRMYWPGVQESAVDNGGFLDAGTRSSIQTIADTFLSDLATNNVQMHILHDSAAVAPTPVTSLNLAAKVATQRRRLR